MRVSIGINEGVLRKFFGCFREQGAQAVEEEHIEDPSCFSPFFVTEFLGAKYPGPPTPTRNPFDYVSRDTYIKVRYDMRETWTYTRVSCGRRETMRYARDAEDVRLCETRNT